MAVLGKIKTTIFVVFLSTALSHGSFGQTAGLDYYLGVFNAPPAETMVELGHPKAVADVESVKLGVGVEDNITPGVWIMPKEGQGAMDLSLGRIEYKFDPYVALVHG